MIITTKILDDLTAAAKENPRLHQSLDLRNTAEDFQPLAIRVLRGV